MPKLLLLLAIIVVVVLLLRRMLKLARGTRAPDRDAATGDGTAAAGVDAKLVRCTACGAFVPKADALAGPDGFRCGGAGCGTPR